MQGLQLQSSKLLRGEELIPNPRAASSVEKKGTYGVTSCLEGTMVRNQEVVNALFKRDFVQSAKKEGTGPVNADP